MKKILLLANLYLTMLLMANAQESSLKILFIGDIMGHEPQIKSAYDPISKIYNYDKSFQYIAPLISNYDLAIANLEVTLNCQPYGGYPSFSSPAALATSMVNSGVDCFVTANNHSADRGTKGVLNTIAVLDSLGVAHTGTFSETEDISQRHPLYIEKNGIKIGLMNYTYGLNGIPIPKGTIINMIDTAQIRRDINICKQNNVDKSIVFIHWGIEYDLNPNKQQTQLAQFIFDCGADIIIGSHPHVVQRAEFDKTKQQVVVYSLGNFVSNQSTRPRDVGALIEIDLTKQNDKTYIDRTGYILTWVYRPITEGKRRHIVIPVSQYGTTDSIVPKSAQMLMDSSLQIVRPIMQTNINVDEIKYNNNCKIWE